MKNGMYVLGDKWKEVYFKHYKKPDFKTRKERKRGFIGQFFRSSLNSGTPCVNLEVWDALASGWLLHKYLKRVLRDHFLEYAVEELQVCA